MAQTILGKLVVSNMANGNGGSQGIISDMDSTGIEYVICIGIFFHKRVQEWLWQG